MKYTLTTCLISTLRSDTRVFMNYRFRCRYFFVPQFQCNISKTRRHQPAWLVDQGQRTDGKNAAVLPRVISFSFILYDRSTFKYSTSVLSETNKFRCCRKVRLLYLINRCSIFVLFVDSNHSGILKSSSK